MLRLRIELQETGLSNSLRRVEGVIDFDETLGIEECPADFLYGDCNGDLTGIGDITVGIAVGRLRKIGVRDNGLLSLLRLF